MNILHTIFIKIAHVIVAILVLVGAQGVSTPSPKQKSAPSTTVDIPLPSKLEKPSVSAPAAIIIAPSVHTGPVAEPLIQDVPVIQAPIETVPSDTASLNVPIYIIQPTPEPTTPVVTVPALEQTQTPLITPMTQARIEIVSPIGIKGLGRDYLARAEIKDEKNYISIGAILYNDDGSINNTAEMVITASDSIQNKTEKGTGDIWGNRYVNGEKQPGAYYAFEYQFKTVGDHTITFAANGLTQSVTIKVPAEDTRP